MRRFVYNIINIVVLFVTALCFFLIYMEFDILFFNTSVFSILLLIITVLVVHGIKSVRFYFMLYGNQIDIKGYLKTYCKVTPVSIVLPFKIGEVFKMFCYGKYIKNYLKGVIIVLLDRFMDTLALVTVMIFVLGYIGGESTITYILLIFLVIVMLAYCVFPRIYAFWKKYLLISIATKNRISILNVLEKLHNAYLEVVSVVKGRGVIGYILSLVAWIIEISSIIIISQIREPIGIEIVISEYLLAAITGKQTVYSSQFIFLTVVSLIILYIILKFCKDKEGRRKDVR